MVESFLMEFRRNYVSKHKHKVQSTQGKTSLRHTNGIDYTHTHTVKTTHIHHSTSPPTTPYLTQATTSPQH